MIELDVDKEDLNKLSSPPGYMYAVEFDKCFIEGAYGDISDKVFFRFQIELNSGRTVHFSVSEDKLEKIVSKKRIEELKSEVKIMQS